MSHGKYCFTQDLIESGDKNSIHIWTQVLSTLVGRETFSRSNIPRRAREETEGKGVNDDYDDDCRKMRKWDELEHRGTQWNTGGTVAFDGDSSIIFFSASLFFLVSFLSLLCSLTKFNIKKDVFLLLSWKVNSLEARLIKRGSKKMSRLVTTIIPSSFITSNYVCIVEHPTCLTLLGMMALFKNSKRNIIWRHEKKDCMPKTEEQSAGMIG